MNEKLQRITDFIKDLPVVGDLLENRPKVAVIRLAGIIADSAVKRQGISYARYARAVEKAFSRPGIGAVALVINSPGGSAAQSALLGGLIRQLAQENDRPVYAFVEDVAASGGYWLACAADEIYAQEVSIVGSIGVISAGFGFEDFIARHGVRRRVHTSGAEKSFLDPFLPERAEDVVRLETLQKDIHATFRDWVTQRRGDKLKGAEKSLFEGQFWAAAPAQDKGLIDGIADVRSFMREKFGDKVKFIEFTPERKFAMPALPGAHLAGAGGTNLADDLLDAAETRALWSRYGL